MRQRRMKLKNRACYLHLINRLAGPEDSYPLTDADKQRGLDLMTELNHYFLLDILSTTWMGHHFHIVCHVPAEPPTLEVAAQRYNAYYEAQAKKPGRKKGKPFIPLNVERDAARLQTVAKQMIDFSAYMGMLQQRFSCYYNKEHKRRGHLWADRFKSVILEEGQSVWSCLKYVELNPVRAGLCQEPADYPFSTWGRLNATGQHPFGHGFIRHLRRCLNRWMDTKTMTNQDVLAEFRGELARTLACDAGKRGKELEQAVREAKEGKAELSFLEPTRHWTDGAIIGSQEFVREIAGLFDAPERVQKKRLTCGEVDNHVLYCYRRVKTG
jgi:putative transposase